MTKPMNLILTIAILTTCTNALSEDLSRKECRNTIEAYLHLKLDKYRTKKSKYDGKAKAYADTLEYVGYLSHDLEQLDKYSSAAKTRTLEIEHTLASVVKTYTKDNQDVTNCADFLLKRRVNRKVSGLEVGEDIVLGLERLQKELRRLRNERGGICLH